MEVVISGLLQVISKLLNARFVRECRMWIRAARARLRWIFSPGAVHLVHLLCLQVVRLHLVVSDRPRGRHTVVVLQLAKVLATHAVQRNSIELRSTAHEVMHLRLERFVLLVVPGVRRHVSVIDEQVLRQPVLGLTTQPVAALEKKDTLARGSEVARERPSASAGANDDDVERAHVNSPSRSPVMMRAAASISAR